MDALPLFDAPGREPGRLALAQGDLEGARAHAQRCLELGTRFNARKNVVNGWRLTGEVAREAREWDVAERALREALRIAEAIGNPTQRWRTHAALARLYAERGQEEAARHAAREAGGVVDGVLSRLPDAALCAA